MLDKWREERIRNSRIGKKIISEREEELLEAFEKDFLVISNGVVSNTILKVPLEKRGIFVVREGIVTQCVVEIQSPDHAPDEIRGEDEGKKGQARADKKGVELPES